MLIEYDPNLVEHAVFEASRQNPRVEAQLHQATDPLYGLVEKHTKDIRFQNVYKAFFCKLKLDRVVSGLIAERPLLGRSVRRVIIRQAASHKKQSAELFIKINKGDSNSESDNLRTIVIQACPHSLLKPKQFIVTMRLELLQIEDMIDEHFAYHKESLLGGIPRHNLIRDRYHVLWNIYAQGRLVREGHGDDEVTLRLAHQLARVFTGQSQQHVQSTLNRILEGDQFTHQHLLDWATFPGHLFSQPSHQPRNHQPAPGEQCPVCGCSTYDWFDLQENDRCISEAVRRDFPLWRWKQGICRQCAEIYAETNLDVPVSHD